MFNISLNLHYFLVKLHCRSQLALNVPAAWRRRGFHCRSDGSKTSKFAQTFGRATAPLAPNRPLSAGIFFLFIICDYICFHKFPDSQFFQLLFDFCVGFQLAASLVVKTFASSLYVSCWLGGFNPSSS